MFFRNLSRVLCGREQMVGCLFWFRVRWEQFAVQWIISVYSICILRFLRNIVTVQLNLWGLWKFTIISSILSVKMIWQHCFWYLSELWMPPISRMSKHSNASKLGAGLFLWISIPTGSRFQGYKIFFKYIVFFIRSKVIYNPL